MPSPAFLCDAQPPVDTGHADVPTAIMTHNDPPPDLDSTRWQAVCNRDATQDGLFVFAVRTTGVYCRPSCPSRRAKRENVQFFTVNQEAEAAGFRPCKRCKPTALAQSQEHRLLVEAACRTLETAEQEPSLGTLAQQAGLSPGHFHRVFKSTTGITPKAYAKAKRAERALAAMEHSAHGQGGAATSVAPVTTALHAAGYGSTSRFYDSVPARLGMDPKTFANGAGGVAILYTIQPCWLGHVAIGATTRGICCVRFGETPEVLEQDLARLFPKAEPVSGHVEFDALVARVLRQISHPEIMEDLPLDIQGSLFQQQVWQALRAIPPGETRSYGEIAAAIGRPAATRAVANACGANPVAIVTPCHRVIRQDGSLGGYRWGEERKRALLDRERHQSGGQDG